MSHEELEHYKIMALDILTEMAEFADMCECLQTVVSVVVNKFGDKIKKV
jgi:hypothetical protein